MNSMIWEYVRQTLMYKIAGTVVIPKDEDMVEALNHVDVCQKALEEISGWAAESEGIRNKLQNKLDAEYKLLVEAKKAQTKAEKLLEIANSQMEDCKIEHKRLTAEIKTHSTALRTTMEKASDANKEFEKTGSTKNIVQGKADSYLHSYELASIAVVEYETKWEAKGNELKRKVKENVKSVTERSVKRIKHLNELEERLNQKFECLEDSFGTMKVKSHGKTVDIEDHNASLYNRVYNEESQGLNLLGHTMTLIRLLVDADCDIVPNNQDWYSQVEVKVKAFKLESDDLTKNLNSEFAGEKLSFIKPKDDETISDGVTELGIIEKKTKERDYVVITFCEDSIVAYSTRTRKAWTCPKGHELIFKFRGRGGTLLGPCVSLLCKGLELGIPNEETCCATIIAIKGPV